MKYLIRSLKYFVALCVLCVVLMALMILTGSSNLTAEETIYLMFHSDRFVLLGVAMVVLAAAYPRFGFITRRVEGDVEQHRTQINNALHTAGFRLVKEEDGVLFFRGDGLLKRLSLLFEDEISVRQYGQWIEIEGIRRGVAKAWYLLDSYIEMVKRNEK
ncbi:MAG: hypothetical protein E7132_01260 [Rikenellaceae bacterium]|nr:hypothetical protein [Rikenellaceae bacterium]